eukprot:SAG11_NODE_3542_length_2380_cov_1.640509_5_plen_268_part_00
MLLFGTLLFAAVADSITMLPADLQGGSSPDKPAGGCLFGQPGKTRTCQMHVGHDGPSKFSAFGIRDGSVELSNDVVALASFADGSAAVTQKFVGQGSIVGYPWLPGISYAYQRALGGEAGLGSLLRNISVRTYRNIIGSEVICIASVPKHLSAVSAWQALAGVCPPVVLSERRVEAPLMLTPDSKSAVITLLNWKCTEDFCTRDDTKVSRLKVEARLPFVAAKLYSATHGDITPCPCPSSATTCSGAAHVVCFEIDLLFADFVTLSS